MIIVPNPVASSFVLTPLIPSENSAWFPCFISITVPFLAKNIKPFLEYLPKVILNLSISKLCIGSAEKNAPPAKFVYPTPTLCPEIAYTPTLPSTVLFV